MEFVDPFEVNKLLRAVENLDPKSINKLFTLCVKNQKPQGDNIMATLRKEWEENQKSQVCEKIAK